MIKEPTVFVLGAGASKPYGFPTGKELFDGVIAGLRKHRDGQGRFQLGELCRRLSPHFRDEQLDALRDGLERTACGGSIDGFLQQTGAFGLAPVAKAAMALILMPAEHERCFIANNGDAWYEYLFSHILPSDVEANSATTNLRVITLNFDRSFEAALRAVITARTRLHPGAVSDLGQALVPTHHLHGTLPFGFPMAANEHPNEHTCRAEVIGQSEVNMRIVTEELPDRALAPAIEHIKWARNVCFLGTQLHKFTLERLAIPQCLADKRFWGTTFQMDGGKVAAVEILFRTVGKQSRSEFMPVTVLEFLKKTSIIHE